MKVIKAIVLSAVVLASAACSADDGAWDQVEGQWSQLKGGAQEKWGDLTDDDMDQLEGNKDQLIGKIQERYGIAKEEAEEQVNEWAESLGLSD